MLDQSINNKSIAFAISGKERFKYPTEFILNAISPSVWLNDHALTKKAKAIIEKSKHEQVSLYLSLADETRMGVYGFMHLLDEI